MAFPPGRPARKPFLPIGSLRHRVGRSFRPGSPGKGTDSGSPSASPTFCLWQGLGADTSHSQYVTSYLLHCVAKARHQRPPAGPVVTRAVRFQGAGGSGASAASSPGPGVLLMEPGHELDDPRRNGRSESQDWAKKGACHCGVARWFLLGGQIGVRMSWVRA